MEELRLVMRKLHRTATDKELRDMIESVDDNGDEAIDFDEFLILAKSRVGEGGPDKDLRFAFSQFDRDKVGYIDRMSLQIVMAEWDQDLTEDEMDAIFAAVDLDGNGKITFKEFRELMVRTKLTSKC